MLKRAFLVLFTLILAAYPLVVYFGLKVGSVTNIALLLLALMAVRFGLVYWQQRKALVSSSGSSDNTSPLSMHWIYVVASVCIVLALVKNDPQYFRFYPVLMNSCFMVAFAYTLWKPPSMIERFGRLLSGEFNEAAISYTLVVTKVWCGFFLLNGLIALYTTLWTSMDTWLLYNGFLSYILMGLLFGIELMFRRYIHKKNQDSGE